MKRLIALLACAFLYLQCPAWPATIAIVTGGDGFRLGITDAATVAFAECHGEPLICSSAFSVCLSDAEIGAIGDVPLGLLPAAIGDKFKHGLPFTKTGSLVTYLAPTGFQGTVPIFTAPAGKLVYLILDEKPARGQCVGVESFFEIDAANEKFCIRRKVYNTCPDAVTVEMEKEFYDICVPGVFTVNNHVAQALVTEGGTIAHVFLSVIPGLNQTHLTAGSVEEGSDFLSEFTTCALTAGLRTGQEVGSRWLEMVVDLRPGGSTLKPAGKPGFERFFGHCVELQCDTVPPGSDCIPQCVPTSEDPGNPGTPNGNCPLSQGYWRTHGSVWPVSGLTIGGKVYTKAELLALLSAAVAGDASKILAKQLIGAKLNIANGSDGTVIAPTIAAADALLSPFAGKLPYGVAPASVTGQQMILLAAQLELYNTAHLTPGCGSED